MRPAPEIAGSASMHPAFARALHEILGRLELRQAQMKGVADATVQDLEEVREFIDVELIKARSALAKSLEEGEEPDSDATMQAMIWYRTLDRFLKDFTALKLFSSVELIDQMIQRLNTMFQEEATQTPEPVQEVRLPQAFPFASDNVA